MLAAAVACSWPLYSSLFLLDGMPSHLPSVSSSTPQHLLVQMQYVTGTGGTPLVRAGGGDALR